MYANQSQYFILNYPKVKVVDAIDDRLKYCNVDDNNVLHDEVPCMLCLVCSHCPTFAYVALLSWLSKNRLDNFYWK